MGFRIVILALTKSEDFATSISTVSMFAVSKHLQVMMSEGLVGSEDSLGLSGALLPGPEHERH